MIKERNIVLCILLSIITCGIYGIYWFCTLTDDALLHLNIYQALRYNVLIIIYIPLILYCIFYKFILKRDCQISDLILYIILILVCLFGILRNIPYFSYLAPTVVSTI